MSVINFAVTIDPSKKEVALKTMALIAAMAELSMEDVSTASIKVYGAEEISPEQEEKLEELRAKMEVVEDESPKQKTPKQKKKQAERKKKVEDDGPAAVEEEETPDEVEETKPEPKKDNIFKKKNDEAKAKKEATKSDVTVEDLRALLKDVVHENKDAIKEKLTEFGGSSISTLPEDKYADMYTYMESLK